MLCRSARDHRSIIRSNRSIAIRNCALTISGFQKRLDELWNGGDEPQEGDWVPGTDAAPIPIPIPGVALDDTPLEDTEN